MAKRVEKTAVSESQGARELDRAVNKGRAFSGAFSIWLFPFPVPPFSVLSLEKKRFSSAHPSSETTGACIRDSLFLLRHGTLKNPLPLD